MIYSVLIYEIPGLADARSTEDQEKNLDIHRELQKDTKGSGVYISSTRLSESGAMTVRHRGTEALVTDGPYAETKELFIGFYLFECRTIEEALALAKRIPISDNGRVEVRPVQWSEPLENSPA